MHWLAILPMLLVAACSTKMGKDGRTETTVDAKYLVKTEVDRIADTVRSDTVDGLLLIADFAPHDHEFLREAHQHRRLGFEDAEIIPWLEAAGLSLENNIALPPSSAQGLTVKIWTARRPVQRAAQRSAA